MGFSNLNVYYRGIAYCRTGYLDWDVVLCTSLQHTRIEYRIQKSTANAARNIYECISCMYSQTIVFAYYEA